MTALKDHFAVTWRQRNGGPLHSVNDKERIWRMSFGAAATVGDALRENPEELLAHVRHNAAGYFESLARLLQPNRKYRVSFYAALGLFALWWSGAVLSNRRRLARDFPLRIKSSLGLLAAVGILIAPPIAAALAIYPHQHYLLLSAVPALLAASLALPALALSAPALPQGAAGESTGAGAAMAAGEARRTRRLWPPAVIGMAGLLAAVFAVQSLAIPARPKPHLLAVRHLQSLGFESLPREMTVFNHWDYGLYMEAGSQFVRVRYFQEWPGFAEARRHYNVHAVVLSPFLAARDARLANDPEWRAFLDDPAANGYATLPTPGLPDWKLLVSEPLRERLNL